MGFRPHTLALLLVCLAQGCRNVDATEKKSRPAPAPQSVADGAEPVGEPGPPPPPVTAAPPETPRDPPPAEAAAEEDSAVEARPPLVEAPTEVLYLSGDPAAIGEKQGARLGANIRQLLERWLLPMFEVVPGVGEVLARFKAAEMRAFVSEEEQAEMNATAKAAGVEPEYVMIANAAADIGQHVSEGNFFGCSSFIVTPARSTTGQMLVGRNLDYPDSAPLRSQWTPVVFAAPGKHKLLSVHAPGMTGVLTGINEHGLFVAIQVSSGRSTSDGVPAAIAFRRVLERAATVTEAEAIWRALARTFAMNVVLADGKDARILEADSAAIDARRPGATGVLYAANHFETETMKPHMKETQGPDARWPILQSHDLSQRLLGPADVAEIVERAGGFGGDDTESNVLAVTVDYAKRELVIASSPNADVKAVRGARRIVIDLAKVFAAGG